MPAGSLLQPIYPRNPIPVAPPSIMSESPRSTTYSNSQRPYQLPPPVQQFGSPSATTSPSASSATTPTTTPRYTGPILAPLAIPGPGRSSGSCSNGGGSSGGATHPRQQHPQGVVPPHGTHIHGQQQSQQLPSPLPSHQPSPQPPNDIVRRTSNLLPNTLSFTPSPSAATFSTGPGYAASESRGYGQSFSGEGHDRRPSRSSTLSTISPTFQPRASPSEPRPVSSSSSGHHQSYGSAYAAPPMPTSPEPLPPRSGSRYEILVRQQPVAARACGFGERDRRVIDPPPIVQLIIPPSSNPDELRYPFNVVHCTLFSIDGKTDETALTNPDNRMTRRLMGTLVSSPFVGRDENDEEGSFFCFPDLSCRTPGKHRLKFVLMRLEPSDLKQNACTPIITEVLSDIFTVYTAKEFPGMRPSTSLTKVLKSQGCAISVKKGNEKALGGGKEDAGDSAEEGDSPYSGNGKSKRRRKT